MGWMIGSMRGPRMTLLINLKNRAYSLLFFVIGSLNLINWLKPEEGT